MDGDLGIPPGWVALALWTWGKVPLLGIQGARSSQVNHSWWSPDTITIGCQLVQSPSRVARSSWLWTVKQTWLTLVWFIPHKSTPSTRFRVYLSPSWTSGSYTYASWCTLNSISDLKEMNPQKPKLCISNPIVFACSPHTSCSIPETVWG